MSYHNYYNNRRAYTRVAVKRVHPIRMNFRFSKIFYRTYYRVVVCAYRLHFIIYTRQNWHSCGFRGREIREIYLLFKIIIFIFVYSLCFVRFFRFWSERWFHWFYNDFYFLLYFYFIFSGDDFLGRRNWTGVLE